MEKKEERKFKDQIGKQERKRSKLGGTGDVNIEAGRKSNLEIRNIMVLIRKGERDMKG